MCSRLLFFTRKMSTFKGFFLLLKFTLIVSFSYGYTPEEFKNFAEMLVGKVTAAQHYILPVDNSKLYGTPNEGQVEQYGSFDFIIVGAGAAGAVLANKLTEIEDVTVLLLEAGGNENDFSDIIGVSVVTQFSEMNWGYFTTPQERAAFGMQNRKILYPVGKVLGGSSTIGEGMYTRGHPEDYDHWEKLGNDGWGYSNLFPYFLNIENVKFPVDDKLRGKSGPVDINLISETEMLPVMLNGGNEAGINVVDTNDGMARSCSLSKVQFMTDYNKRVSSAKAFLSKIRNRKNLNINQNAFVTQVLIDPNTKIANGVKFVKNDVLYVATATKEVILSAGVINSPQLLMLSGIGPKQHLQELGIDPILDLPVGQNLQDHMYYSALNFRTNHTFYENTTLPEFLGMYLENIRPLTSGLCTETIGFISTDNKLSWPDIEFVMVSPPTTKFASVNYLNLDKSYLDVFKNDPLTDFFIAVILMHPKSIGELKLRSKNPIDFPLINPNYLSDANDEDIATLYNGIQFMLNNLTQTAPFKSISTTLAHPPIKTCNKHKEFSKEWWYCSIRTVSSTLYHPIGTTSMGKSPKTSVVNSQLMVHGMKNLRVVDAGVMPSHITGHLLGPTYVIAEKAADIIKMQFGI